ncbi:MAG: ferritin family protein [Woeseiaceae bacterium]
MSGAPESHSQAFSMAELLVHALVIELEAVQSYRDLAEQMFECNNTEVAELFVKMAELEAQHAQKIREKVGDIELPELAPWEYRWPGLEAPENIDLAGVHYLMTPHHALQLALENELNAKAFFEGVANGSTDARVRSLAIEFAEDERQHVAWMEDWLAKYPEPGADWDDDPDAPPAID